MEKNRTVALAVGTWLLSATLAVAQMTPDLTDLAAKVEDAEASLSRSGQFSSSSQADRSAREREVQDFRDELGYLRVKSRRGDRVTDAERRDLGQRIDRFLDEASGRASNIGARRGGAPAADGELPVGTELDVRLQNRLSSKDAQVEDRVEATTVVDLMQGERVLIPAGSLLTGYVTSVDRASHTDRRGELTLRFESLRVSGRSYDIRGSVVGAIESEGLKGEKDKIIAGSGVGAIIGGVLGGLKGAIAGIVIGGSGAVLATEGKDVELPPGSVLRIRLDSPVTIP